MASCPRIRNVVDRGPDDLGHADGLVLAPNIGGGLHLARGGRNDDLDPGPGDLDLEVDADLRPEIVSDCVDLFLGGNLGIGGDPGRDLIRRHVNVDLRIDDDRRLDRRNRDRNRNPDVSRDLNRSHVVSRVLNQKPDTNPGLNPNLDVNHVLNRKLGVSLVRNRRLGDKVVPSRRLVASLVLYRKLVLDLDHSRTDQVGLKVEDLLKKMRGQRLWRNDPSLSPWNDFAVSEFRFIFGHLSL